ncbi:MAG: tetratricopeptide repeat protein [Gemmatimonadaceae bacterium]
MNMAPRLILLLAMLTAPLLACAQPSGDATSTLQQAERARRTGQYDDALSLARRAIAADTASAPAYRLLMRTLMDVGRYGEAVEEGERARARLVRPSRIEETLGDAYRARGQLAEARAAYERAGTDADSLTARLYLAELALERGERAQAMAVFDFFIDSYNRAPGQLSAAELRAVAVACRHLAHEDPQLVKDALRAYDASIASDSTDLDTRVELGLLFLEKFNGPDARAMLEGVLQRNPRHARALLAMARLTSFEGRGDAAALVRQSLEVNPRDAAARAYAALLLLDVERYAEAADEAIRGLAADSGAPAPLIALAAARYLSADTVNFRRALNRAHERLPGSADAEVVLADVAARNRLYREAVAFAEAGVARDAKAARALALLGINQLRIGLIAEGKRSLERSFAADPYDVWAKNTLDLLDTFDEYEERRTPRFVIAMERKDAELLDLYVTPLAELAFDSLSARYGYRPDGPIRIELFRSHADFSVRTVGLAGLGALGVCFGNVIAMDSPAARPVGEFNWGSTLWHELAHTFSLGASGNRVPRWFSEGLAVHEERRARPSWGSDVSPQFIAAYKGGMLAPPSRMNDGFMRPRFPEEVGLSYFQASLVAEWIEQEKGLAGIRAMLAAYAKGATTESAIRQLLDVDLAGLDSRFDAYVRAKYAREFTAVTVVPAKDVERATTLAWEGPFADAMRRATTSAERQDWDTAVRELEQAKSLFPSYAGDDSPYRSLARIHLTRGNKAAAERELASMAARNENAYQVNLELAGLAKARGDSRVASAALERALYISPFEPALHLQLAEQAATASDHATAVRERRASLALDPADRVEAMYELARAYAEAGDVVAARREVLRTLDLAPHFEKAQALLLSLRGRTP